MGDRAAVSIKQEQGENVYIYTQWGGAELPATLRRAIINILDGGDDEITNPAVVAARIAAAMGEETIVGLESNLSHIEYPLLVVDPRSETIVVQNTAYAEIRARICHHLVPGVDLLIVGHFQQSHTTYDPVLRAAELKKTVECPAHCDISVVGNFDDRTYTFEEFTDLPQDVEWGSLGDGTRHEPHSDATEEVPGIWKALTRPPAAEVQREYLPAPERLQGEHGLGTGLVGWGRTSPGV